MFIISAIRPVLRPLIWLLLALPVAGYSIPLTESKCLTFDTQAQHIHIAKIDLRCPTLQLLGTAPQDRGITTSAFAQQSGANIAINANFYWADFTPIGLTVTNYQKWSKYGDTKARTLFACDKQNHCLIEKPNHISPIDRKWKLVISGWQFYDAASIQFRCSTNDKIGCSQDIFNGKHPRTLLGMDKENRWLYLVVVEGRQWNYAGMTLNELAKLAHQLNLAQAINLDGGGSSTMVIDGKRVSARPFFQSSERKVANHFGVKVEK